MAHEWNFKRDREFLGTAHLAAQLDEAEAYQLLLEQARAGAILRSEGDHGAAGHVRITGRVATLDWVARHRVSWAYDFLDYYVSLDPWSADRVKLDGEWPLEKGPALAIGFHFGPGFWPLVQLGRQGLAWSAIFAGEVNDRSSAKSPFEHVAYTRLRRIEELGRGRVLQSSQARAVLEALDAGRVVVSMADTHPTKGNPSMDVRALGHTFRWSATLIEHAVRRGIPVVFFGPYVDGAGRRRLVTQAPLVFPDMASFALSAGSFFDQLMQLDSPSWRHWAGAAAFLAR